MGKHVLFLTPITAVAFIVFAVFVVGAPQPYLGARVRGGPTEGARTASWRVEVRERLLELEDVATPERITVDAVAKDGRRQSWSGGVDALGTASVDLSFGDALSGPLQVSVTAEGVRRPLARGSVELSVDDWSSSAKRLGGFSEAQGKGPLRIRVAPERGALAVPFRDAIWVDVRDAEGVVAGAELAFRPEGVDLHPPGRVATDSAGRARLELTVINHWAVVEVTATAGERSGNVSVELPVVPGALDARVAGGEVVVTSPIVRESAWVSIVDARGRLGGGRVPLTDDQRGRAVGSLSLPSSAGGPVWAVVSSESDMESMALVGWPLGRPSRPHGDPPATFNVGDRLLLDGLVGAHEADARRRSYARWLALLFTLASAALVGLVLFRRVRLAQARIEEHLRRESDEEDERARLAPSSGTGMAAFGIALSCVLLGFAVIALVAIYRLG